MYCNRQTSNPGANKTHEKHCKSNPDYVKFERSPLAGRKRGEDYNVWNRGKKLHYDVGTKGKPGTFLGKKHTEDTKKLMSDAKKELYANGWEPTCGRCKKYDHISPIAGHIKVDGTWELATAKYLDSINVTWCRNKKRFPYVKLDGKISTYQPDFYVETWDTYIEVKGYETDLDRIKWSQFPAKLEVWREDKIKTMES